MRTFEQLYLGDRCLILLSLLSTVIKVFLIFWINNIVEGIFLCLQQAIFGPSECILANAIDVHEAFVGRLLTFMHLLCALFHFLENVLLILIVQFIIGARRTKIRRLADDNLTEFVDEDALLP